MSTVPDKFIRSTIKAEYAAKCQQTSSCCCCCCSSCSSFSMQVNPDIDRCVDIIQELVTARDEVLCLSDDDNDLSFAGVCVLTDYFCSYGFCLYYKNHFIAACLCTSFMYDFNNSRQ